MIEHLLVFVAAGALSGALTGHALDLRRGRELAQAAAGGAVMGLLIALTVRPS